MLIDRNELEADICRESFWDFVQRFWDVIVPEKPIWNWHIPYLCSRLQELAEGVFLGKPKEYDLVVNIPPGSTKSTICSVMFPVWVWTRMPQARSICASYAHPLSIDLSRKSRNIIMSDKWKRLFPDIRMQDDQNTKGYFANTQGGSRFSVGTNGSVTGQHGHFILIDDPIDPLQANSDADLKTANTWIAETLSTRKVDKLATVTILIMQRLHQADPSAEMLEKAKKKGLRVKHVCLPAEIDEATKDSVHPKYLATKYVNGMLDPVRLPKSVLEDAMIELGEYGYAGQFLQSPVPIGGGMFKTDRLHLAQRAPQDIVRRIRFWDKAGTQGGGMYSVGVLMGITKEGQYWILDVVRGRWESSAREQIMLQTARFDGVDVEIGIEQEPGSGGKESTEGSIRNLAGFRVRVNRPTGDKVLRADPFSVQVNGGNVYVVQGPWVRDYYSELSHFPRSKYKDQVDASSGAFSILTRKRVRVGGLG